MLGIDPTTINPVNSENIRTAIITKYKDMIVERPGGTSSPLTQEEVESLILQPLGL